MVLAQLLFFFILRGFRHRCEEPGLENFACRSVHLRDVTVYLHDDGEDVVRLAIFIFAEDENAVAILYARALLLWMRSS